MHARLNRFIGMEAEALAGSLEWFEREGLPRLASTAGYRTIFFGLDLAGGKATGMTFWEDERTLRASEPVEAKIRDEALRRAGGDRAQGLVDTYLIAHFECEPAAVEAHAVLTRWEGLRPAVLQESLDYFRDTELPKWRQQPEFGGIVAGWNLLLGNSFGCSFWIGTGWHHALGAERDTEERIESRFGALTRPIFADVYQAALVPHAEAVS